jgi:adenosylhomocysteine nucleosidase
MTVGIVTASPREAATLLTAPVKPLQTYSLGADAWVIAAGTGMENALRASEWLLANGATALLSWGLASGLNPGLPAGSVLLPQRVRIDPDSRLPGKKPSNLQYLTTDKNWRRGLLTRLQADFLVSSGDVLYCDRWLTDKNAKQALYQLSSASAMDMSSMAVGWAAREAGIPFAVLRVVADPAGLALPRTLPRAMDSYGRISPARLIPGLLLRPHDCGSLLKFGRRSRAGLAALRRLAGTLQADFAPEPQATAEAVPQSG